MRKIPIALDENRFLCMLQNMANAANHSPFLKERYGIMEFDTIQSCDPEIAAALRRELARQSDTLELIASENIVSPAVMAAQGSIMTNKYAEGYPAKRYYGGCEFVDIAEELAIERARVLFHAAYANVQPHSGSQANMAVYFAMLDPGDAVLGMALDHGGHLTHGSPVSFSGRLFKFAHYGVRPDSCVIDYDEVESLARKHRPRLIVAGASAYPRMIDFQAFADICQAVGAKLMVDMAHIAGLVAAGLHPSPLPHADVVTSTTHKTLRGPRGGLILSAKDFGPQLNKQIFPGIQGGPLMHVIAAKAVAFKEALTPQFADYQRKTVKNAAALAEALLEHGVQLVSGGTDNHMILVDLRQTDITGKTAESALGAAGITVNKNAVPFDTRNPHETSGFRIGAPAITSRGMGTNEMRQIAGWIASVIERPHDDSLLAAIHKQVGQLCSAFPIYQN